MIEEIKKSIWNNNKTKTKKTTEDSKKE